MASTRKHVTIGYEPEAETGDAKRIAVEAPAKVPVGRGLLPSHRLPGIPVPDNAAVAVGIIKAGSALEIIGIGHCADTCAYDIPEGHRFATEAVAKGETLRSWGLPFGIALRDIAKGEYLCNILSLETFRGRNSKLHLPAEPNFENSPFARFELDKQAFKAAPAKVDEPEKYVARGATTFKGYPRTGGRGTGTRNYVVILGVTSQVAGFARSLEKKFKDMHHVDGVDGNCDGVVAVAHTEAGVNSTTGDKIQDKSNYGKIMRVLSGFAVHPNVGGVLFVENGTEILRTSDLLQYMAEHGYPLDTVPHRTLTLSGNYAKDAATGEAQLRELLDAAKGGAARTDVPLSELCLAQQCGGSDAFSGISANPLMGCVARQLVANKGSVILAETDALIGAEGYILDRLDSADTGQKFLDLVNRFYRYSLRFGHSPEGNPSGGNLFRGLYNIALKSAGAAMKKSPDLRLDHVLEYGEQLARHGSGYSFMDSPGNDLESIAGQVASGCNVVCFTTGNGAITNHPFVPTVKVLTTTQRYELLSKDMDINAGVYVDGSRTMEELTASTFEYIVDVASGMRSKGEMAGHHQVQIWREWNRQPGDDVDISNGKETRVAELGPDPGPMSAEASGPEADSMRDGVPLALKAVADGDARLPTTLATARLSLYPVERSSGKVHTSNQVGLIVPTSLCSSQVSEMLAARLQKDLDLDSAAYGGTLSKFIALPHTEGCGRSGGESENMYVRTMLGYATHPMVPCAVLVEHGCEKTHNDHFATKLKGMGEDPAKMGYASIQLDGGIDSAYVKIKEHFVRYLSSGGAHGGTGTAAGGKLAKESAPASSLRVGMIAAGPVPLTALRTLGTVAAAITSAGGTVVTAGEIQGASFLHMLLDDGAEGSNETLGYGQRALTPGLHRMHSPTKHMVEMMTGMGGTGVETIIVFAGDRCVEVHPMLPIIQVSMTAGHGAEHGIDVAWAPGTSGDLDEHASADTLLARIVATLNRTTLPALYESGVVNFQMTRGAKGISL